MTLSQVSFPNSEVATEVSYEGKKVEILVIDVLALKCQNLPVLSTDRLNHSHNNQGGNQNMSPRGTASY